MPKILVVDDSEDFLQLARTYLAKEEYIVETSKDAFQAIEKLDKQKFDLLITDVNMPYKSGYDFVSELRNSLRFKSIPILFVSGRSSKTDIVRAANVGGDSYIIKPIVKDFFVEKVKNLLRGKPKASHKDIAPDDKKANGLVTYNFSGKVVKIYDNGIHILQKWEIPIATKIKYTSELLKSVGIESNTFEVIHCQKQGEEYVLILSFTNLSEEEKLKLSKYITT